MLVATVRALKFHGGKARKALSEEDPAAVEKGAANLAKHVENIRRYGLPVVVAINAFSGDSQAEWETLQRICDDLGVRVALSEHWARGSAGAEALAEAVVETAETQPSSFHPLYPDEMPLWEKIRTVAQEIYGADDISGDARLRKQIAQLEQQGYGHLPVCLAKTQYSLSSDPLLRGRPQGFEVPVREVRLSAGAGFIVVLTGDMVTMPGLPRVPAAEAIDLDDNGQIKGLF